MDINRDPEVLSILQDLEGPPNEGTFEIWEDLAERGVKRARRQMIAWRKHFITVDNEPLARRAHFLIFRNPVDVTPFEPVWEDGVAHREPDPPPPPPPRRPKKRFSKVAIPSLPDPPPASPPEKPPAEDPPKVKQKRKRAVDHGPKTPVGQVHVENRKVNKVPYTGPADDYFGDGSYTCICPGCGETKTYLDFGSRIMTRKGKPAKLVQPRCKPCRRSKK